MDKNKKTISELVKEKIKKEELKPIPKWHFLLKHGFLWILLLVLLLIAMISVGITIFEFVSVEWDLRPKLGLGIWPFLMTIFPFFWVVVFGIVGVLAYYNFMVTPKGYKHPKYQIVLFGLLVVLLAGTAFHYLGLARGIRDRIEGVPFFEHFLHDKEALWNNPENGLLSGVIVSIDENDQTVAVKSFDGKIWNVDITEIKLPPNKKIENGQRVKIIGEKIDENLFKASEARPWQKGDMLRFGEKPGLGLKNGSGPKNGTKNDFPPPPDSNY